MKVASTEELGIYSISFEVEIGAKNFCSMQLTQYDTSLVLERYLWWEIERLFTGLIYDLKAIETVLIVYQLSIQEFGRFLFNRQFVVEMEHGVED